uniref:Uncharacterized protein n=1 Tax=Anopheles atroparvus TaxID=41427 RepID=A0AAG5D4Q0_ANOAO
MTFKMDAHVFMYRTKTKKNIPLIDSVQKFDEFLINIVLGFFFCCCCTQVSTKAPLECMCRPCTGIEDANVIPQELTSFADEGTLTGYFQKSHYKSIE